MEVNVCACVYPVVSVALSGCTCHSPEFLEVKYGRAEIPGIQDFSTVANSYRLSVSVTTSSGLLLASQSQSPAHGAKTLQDSLLRGGKTAFKIICYKNYSHLRVFLLQGKVGSM